MKRTYLFTIVGLIALATLGAVCVSLLSLRSNNVETFLELLDQFPGLDHQHPLRKIGRYAGARTVAPIPESPFDGVDDEKAIQSKAYWIMGYDRAFGIWHG